MANKYDDIMVQFEGTMRLPLPTEAQLNDIEARLGYALPADYKEFLRGYGGEYLLYRGVVYPVTFENYVDFETIFLFFDASSQTDIAEGYSSALGSDTEVSGYLGMSVVNGKTYDLNQVEYGWPPELMSIACDKGGNQICLALFGLRPGAIFFWVNAPSAGDQNVYLVADSFDDFMHLLRKAE